MAMVKGFTRLEEHLLIGLEVRKYADGYWEIDGLATTAGHIGSSHRIPLCSGKQTISQAHAGMVQRVVMEQLRSLLFLTGEEETL